MQKVIEEYLRAQHAKDRVLPPSLASIVVPTNGILESKDESVEVFWIDIRMEFKPPLATERNWRNQHFPNSE
jgi:hypothetical protein